jgi:hypothetical protein
VVQALRQLGCTVQDLAAVGDGCPDILVGFRGRNLCLEIKDGAKPSSARTLTPEQVVWHHEWRGQVVVVASREEAIRAVTEVER